MLKTTTVVVGAGHTGLAMSRCLADRSIDHVVLERGEVANSWRTQRWDSLRLLTPNWMTRLPGFAYGGEDPDGYLTASETAQLIADYAKDSAAPVRANTTVISVRPVERGYVVQTDQDTWHARTVVSASGGSAVPHVPALRDGLPAGITSLTPTDYRNPSELPDGGVLVVGASASGVQIAEELHRSGRPVTLAVGEHVRCRAPIGARTSCGGWTRRGCSTSATTRSPTFPGLAGCRRCSWSAHPSAEPSTSTRCAGSVCDWSAGWPASGMGLRNSPARWPTSPRWLT